MTENTVCPHCSRSVPYDQSEGDEGLVCRYCGGMFTPQGRRGARGRDPGNESGAGEERVLGVCARCEGRLRFAHSRAGESIICPHCGERTRLDPLSPQPVPDRTPQDAEWEYLGNQGGVLPSTPRAPGLEKPRATSQARQESSDGCGCAGCYEMGAIVTGVLTFLGVWIYCVVAYGFLLGVGLGWLPAMIVACVAALIWPLIAIVFIILAYLVSRS